MHRHHSSEFSISVISANVNTIFRDEISISMLSINDGILELDQEHFSESNQSLYSLRSSPLSENDEWLISTSSDASISNFVLQWKYPGSKQLIQDCLNWK